MYSVLLQQQQETETENLFCFALYAFCLCILKSKHVFEENWHHERESPNSTDLTPKTRVTVRKRRLSKNTYVINSLRWAIVYYIYEIGTAYYGKQPVEDLGIEECDC